ncbi:hypothetical protein [Shewanella sp. HN-41]|uniref:hypothetical protein n=1 Tax=Shewanella sp. HN-41 TaxID=327275 RepID=UPI0002126941|nr:hypothetical protein [Shewanella sp. HN-41]EGM70789.1 hypothetical protein SOHN41_01277 [Shewanella sp. HN-41]
MRRDDVPVLIRRLKERYGEKYELYGSSENEQEGTGFRINNIPATFSVLCFGDIPIGRYDFQIESYPPGDYLYTGEKNLSGLLELIERYREPMDEWQSITFEAPNKWFKSFASLTGTG